MKMKRLKSRLVLVTAFISLLGLHVKALDSQDDVYATGFYVVGHMQAWSSIPTIFSQGETWEFEVAVKGGQWTENVIHTTNETSFSFGCDGNSVFMIQSPPGTVHQQTGDKSDLAMVVNGCCPIQSPFLDSALPWLAYCSGNYIATNISDGTVMLPAPWMASWVDPTAWIFKERYQAITNGQNLPGRLDYFPDVSLIEDLERGVCHTIMPMNEIARENATVGIARMKLQRDASAFYEVLETTNFGGYLLPKRFVFEQASFKSVGKDQVAKEPEPLIKILGTLDSVAKIDALNPYPKSSANLEVSDYRLSNFKQHIPFVWYRVANSAWIVSKSNPTLLRLAGNTGADLAPLTGLKAVITARRIFVAAFFCLL
jgi:hypothetical protein